MGRIRKQRVIESEHSPDAAVEELDVHGWLAKLRQKSQANAPQVDPFTADEQAQAEARRQIVDRRLARLNAAGGLDPEAVAAASQAIGKCPAVAGHKGSERAASAAQTFLNNPSIRTMILGGPTGRGKSFASTWIVAEWPAASAWIAASEVRVSDSWSALRPKAETTKLLVIDDLGRESTDWAGRELADVIELRHNRGLRTVATTNFTRDQVFARYGERLASRLTDTRLAMLVDVLGADLRKR